jgi:hypothetical protein
MIIILEPQKDTYVTNLKTQNNDASLANVGHAATLDLFKLYNENKNSHSWAVFEFSNTPSDLISNGNTLTLIDSVGVSKTFEFDTDDPANVAGDNIRINIKAANDINDNRTYAATIAASINAVNDLDIIAYSNSNNQLILKQNKPGESGDTNIVFNMTNTSLKNKYIDDEGDAIRKFARIEYSNILIKFDLENFKKSWNIGNDITAEGAFNNLKAELILKDVTTGISKPKDYSLELYSLNKDFDEGIGKDTIYFSDSDTCNFKDISSTQTWEVQNIISDGDAAALSTASSTGNIEKGDEDLAFNITNYVKAELEKGTVADPALTDKGFLIKFLDSDIYDNKSYFVKRLGSRHLINKKFVPQLRIKIDDSSYNIPTNSFNKVRYLDSTEDFYLFNRANGLNQSFKFPVGFDPDTTLKMKISSRDTVPVDFVTLIANNHTDSPVTNFSGDPIPGIRKVLLSDTELSRFNSNISDKIKNNKLEAKITWFWDDGINSHTISEENTQFSVSENINETKYENLVTSIRITENDLFANDGTNSVEVYFVDTKKEFTAVKVPYELPSENIGEVFYQVYDVETGNILIDYDNPATKMFYDGEKYKFNLFVPNLFKNLRINFKFKYKDPITNVNKFIFNKKYSVRII